jgi:hypothetical protein
LCLEFSGISFHKHDATTKSASQMLSTPSSWHLHKFHTWILDRVHEVYRARKELVYHPNLLEAFLGYVLIYHHHLRYLIGRRAIKHLSFEHHQFTRKHPHPFMLNTPHRMNFISSLLDFRLQQSFVLTIDRALKSMFPSRQSFSI